MSTYNIRVCTDYRYYISYIHHCRLPASREASLTVIGTGVTPMITVGLSECRKFDLVSVFNFFEKLNFRQP